MFSDQDGDGIKDTEDECPSTTEGLDVDEKGCALSQKDTDGDGIFDDLDHCPDTKPIEELEFNFKNTFTADVSNTLLSLDNSANQNSVQPTLINLEVDEKGCGPDQRDTDGDGIVDLYDNCPKTPNADQSDKDGDGIGDECDTDNELPSLLITELLFAEKPIAGAVIGEIKALDPEGEEILFINRPDIFDNVLKIGEDGKVTVINSNALTFNSKYNVNLSLPQEA